MLSFRVAAGTRLVAIGLLSAAAACAGRTPPEAAAEGTTDVERSSTTEPIEPPAELAPDVEEPPSGAGGGRGTSQPPPPEVELPACAADALVMPGYTNTALYHFEETQGAALLDVSGNPVAEDAFSSIGGGGTLEGGRRTEGHCGRALSFDAAGAHATIGGMGPLFDAGIALSVWLRPASIDAGLAHVVGDGGGGISSFQLVLEAGAPSLRLEDDFGEWHEMMRANAPLVAGVWQHIVVQYEPGAGSILVDDSEVATTDIVRPIQGSYNTIKLGALNNLNAEGFFRQYLGDLDELAIFAR